MTLFSRKLPQDVKDFFSAHLGATPFLAVKLIGYAKWEWLAPCLQMDPPNVSEENTRQYIECVSEKLRTMTNIAVV